MPKFLVQGSYTESGAKGLLDKGGSARKLAVEDISRQLGCTLEAMYFAFGSDDVYSIIEAPDNASIAALSLAVAASGTVTTKTVVLLTPEEVDAAAGKPVTFRPPGV
ncbi:GYD domain-containing protein [Actinopolymorpha sp. NPDC004070]|uniref:GYD domain-containing protein n=1 Tax=Actinopolymorpha sp. NPDC004070 TaxID=3154548 RepID=UPI0033B741A5